MKKSQINATNITLHLLRQVISHLKTHFGEKSDKYNHIPDICHLVHLHVGGEEICHVEKFQISIHGISPHEEEFQFFHTTDVEKCEFLPNLVKFHISPQDRCEEI